MSSAKILLDSVNPTGNRLTTWLLTYPRFIHAEFMTHRCFSRNAASSRAIPIEKMVDAIEECPAEPEYWGVNQRGMQAEGEVSKSPRRLARGEWKAAMRHATATALNLERLGIHKQIANRVIEPWAHITVIATATEHANFFKLRAHKDAQPEFQVLAYTMLREYISTVPGLAKWGSWHLPFGPYAPEIELAEALKISTARCAKVSYLTHDADATPDKLFALHDRLAASGHWSPFEHCAQANPQFPGNFIGWKSYRKNFADECPQKVDLAAILNATPSWVTEAIARNDSR
jgi:thymidylate synthase ThyX